MTERVTKRKRPESTEAKYNRLSKRAVRRLPMTSAETWWLWDEKSRRMRAEKIVVDHVAVDSIQKVLKFADDGLLRFKRDPATSDYQFGYKACLDELMDLATRAQEDEDARAVDLMTALYGPRPN